MQPPKNLTVQDSVPLKPLRKLVKATVAAACKNLKYQIVEGNAPFDEFQRYQKCDCGYSPGFKCF